MYVYSQCCTKGGLNPATGPENSSQKIPDGTERLRVASQKAVWAQEYRMRTHESLKNSCWYSTGLVTICR